MLCGWRIPDPARSSYQWVLSTANSKKSIQNGLKSENIVYITWSPEGDRPLGARGGRPTLRLRLLVVPPLHLPHPQGQLHPKVPNGLLLFLPATPTDLMEQLDFTNHCWGEDAHSTGRWTCFESWFCQKLCILKDVNLLSTTLFLGKIGRIIQCLCSRVVLRIKRDGEVLAGI